MKTHKHGRHPTGFNTAKHMDVPEDSSVMISAAGNDHETHTHTHQHSHKRRHADHEPFVTSTPVRVFTLPYRGLWDQISSGRNMGWRKKSGRESRHLEMPGGWGGGVIEEDAEVLSKHVSFP